MKKGLQIARAFPITLFYLLCNHQVNAQIGNQVTEIITDFGGYWRSGIGNINPVRPNNSHNLLAFTYDGVTYSTGVNDALLITPPAGNLPVAFVPRTFNAIAVSSLPGTLTTQTKMGLGALYDGINNGESIPAPSAALSYYLMDGPQGLNLGTGIANLPVGTLRFDVNNLQGNAIGNGVPDILITQYANPSSSTDRYSFRDINNQIVGNEVSISLPSLNVVGNWTADFYETTPNRYLQATFRQTDRPLRLWAADLNQFGLTPTNVTSVVAFQITLSGESDQAFVAYNTSALYLAPDELPGGVGKQPSLWIKANNGPNTMTDGYLVNDWADKSGKANNASQATVAQQPTFRTQGSNFNPTVNFGAHNLNTFQNISIGDGQPYTSFIVAQVLNTSTEKVLLGSTGTTLQPSVRQAVTSTNGSLLTHSGTNVFSASPAFGTNTRIWSTLYQGALGNRLLLDMTPSQSGTNTVNFTNRPSQIGRHQSIAATGNANISEVITYPMALTDNEIQRINTYLAVKYGITLPVNYLGCNSNVLFESDGPGTVQLFDNRITGIGRENCQVLNQKQSKSILAGSLVTIGAADTIATDNPSNTALLSDGYYLLFGDNNASMAWGSGTVGGSIQSRMLRTWKTQVTGTGISTRIRVPASTSTEATKLAAIPAGAILFMLVKNNTDFTSGYTAVPMTLSGTNYQTNYVFPTGIQYFTFGYMIPNPLPVELVSFEATPHQERVSVELTWSTATEINNDYFLIEKSQDGINWSILGIYDGAGNSNIIKEYLAHDLDPYMGLSYYRLKQYDYDGTETLEGIRSVSFNQTPQFYIFPNPATKLVTITGEKIDIIEIFDASGKIYKTESQNPGPTWTLDVGVFPQGIYYFRIGINGKYAIEKVVISK